MVYQSEASIVQNTFFISEIDCNINLRISKAKGCKLHLFSMQTFQFLPGDLILYHLIFIGHEHGLFFHIYYEMDHSTSSTESLTTDRIVS